MGRKRTGQLLLGLGLSALFLWLAVRQLDFGQVMAALQQVRVLWLVPAIVTLALDIMVRSARWGVLLRPVLPFAWRRLVPVMTIGYMGNVLLPARLGELLRAGVLGRHAAAGEGLPTGSGIVPAVTPQVGNATSAALGTIATERVFDGLTTVAILAVTSWFLPRPSWLVAGLVTVTLLFVGGLIALCLMLAFRPVFLALLERLFGRYQWSARPITWVGQFLAGLAVLRSPRLLVLVVGWSLLAWLLSALEYYWVMLACNVPLGLVPAFFTVAAVSLSTAIPSAPGYVGTFEFAGVAVLGALGVPAAAAFTFTVVMHLVLTVPITFAGLVLLWREGFSSPYKAGLSEAR